MKKLILFIFSLAIFACSQNPITGRKQLMLVSDAQMDSMGFQEYHQFLTENKTKVATSGNDVTLVKKVGTRIAAAVTQYMTEKGLADKMKGYNWEFNLVNDPTVNAWCMPGGKVVVYSGLLAITKNETGLAVVLGHEISHAIAGHGNERMSAEMVQQLGISALDAALSSKPAQTRQLFEGAVGMGAQVGIMLPFSRKQESEADHMGLIFMAMAGYDPSYAVSFWKDMAAQSQGSPPAFLSDHPSDATRISDIQNKFLPEALKYYKK
ncbi:MAG: Peptidase family [Bacteroidota bacterium]|nr:Peptidase family [Bacteroidota bacterium]